MSNGNSMSINNSYLTSGRYGITINSEKYGEVEMAITNWPHPSVRRPAARAPARSQDVPYQGSRIEYDDLNVTIQLDSSMENYWTLYDWMLTSDFEDVILTVYSSNDKPTSQTRYKDAFVEALGQVNHSSTDQSDEILTVDVTIKYTAFERV